VATVACSSRQPKRYNNFPSRHANLLALKFFSHLGSSAALRPTSDAGPPAFSPSIAVKDAIPRPDESKGNLIMKIGTFTQTEDGYAARFARSS
jgi:hypothetical protein